jgi:hypothetical protein
MDQSEMHMAVTTVRKSMMATSAAMEWFSQIGAFIPSL